MARTGMVGDFYSECGDSVRREYCAEFHDEELHVPIEHQHI